MSESQNLLWLQDGELLPHCNFSRLLKGERRYVLCVDINYLHRKTCCAVFAAQQCPATNENVIKSSS